jgi:hypothetical protein
VAERSKQFTTTVTSAGRGRVFIAVPFDPDTAWGTKTHHRVAGTIGGQAFRGVIDQLDGVRVVILGPAWCRDPHVGPGAKVRVVVHPEGVQRADLGADIAAALDTDPVAGMFFDSLAQFYRNAYVRWIEATKRRPDVRAARIAEMVELLRDGRKERPRS